MGGACGLPRVTAGVPCTAGHWWGHFSLPARLMYHTVRRVDTLLLMVKRHSPNSDQASHCHFLKPRHRILLNVILSRGDRATQGLGQRLQLLA